MFSIKALRDAFVPPLEGDYFLLQVKKIGWNSLSLVLASGFALGIVMTLHTRSTLVQFGAEAEIPSFQSMSFFNEIGPLVALLIAGRVGAGSRLRGNRRFAALLGLALALIFLSIMAFFSFVISGLLFLSLLKYGLLFLVTLVGVSILLSGKRGKQ